ncbi:hypothetical protein CW745_00025 [Psychromonas sp. psych-6C06]|uniref:NlpC/P60 family protein n=1 Tax=Psychromonas sp. psych-6C06 TaxID=2058089 RepID=UPI000C337A7B|nr:hypothetical protein CW745_00025 [Psychromonas sp. psych-6C06]
MNHLFIILSLLLLVGCASQPKSSVPSSSVKKSSSTLNTDKQAMGEDALLFSLLRNEFNDWRGTPYRLGGENKQGVDCSAFVQQVMRNSINIKLPRTTETQSKQGYLVYKDQLKVGDLVFFKTGWKARHVGIYMGNNQFMHASTSKGVITSSLNNVYWKKKYWQAKRIID